MAQQVLTITQVNEYIRSMMDGDRLLANVAIKGEISNYKVYPSGHHYFTLKDDGSTLKCVLFKGNATKLRFRPENGMQVIAMGRITVYPRDGAYQMYCTAMAMDGIGDLYALFEQLKNKLAAKGLFDPAHKKPLPQYPNRIGIITSSAGAAVHDMIRILRKRYPVAKVVLLPVRVQGREAPDEIVSAIAYANIHQLADVLIVGRGGGSMEDLWAFNDERVAWAIYNSHIPVVSAVGHEPDVTISDFVADLRAATPSNAAELVVPDQDALRQTLDGFSAAMIHGMNRHIQAEKQRLRVLSEAPVLTNPDRYFAQWKQALQLMRNRLTSAQEQQLHGKMKEFATMTAKLDAMSPLKVLSRGYSVTQKPDGTIIRSTDELTIGESIHITLENGYVQASVQSIKEREA